MTIDLTNWSWTGPIDKDGKFKGTASIVKPIPKGFQKSPYFVQDDNGITFAAVVEGATTSGSNYARSELRELINGKEAAWKTDKDCSLEATLKVLEVPTKSKDKKPGRIVIGQIHGPKDELCRLYYDNGEIYFYDDKAGPSKKETKFELVDANGVTSNIKLGEQFEYTIKVSAGRLSVSVKHGLNVYNASEIIGPFWKGKACYFKAGVYLGVGKEGSGAGTVGTGKGIAQFNRIEVKHF